MPRRQAIILLSVISLVQMTINWLPARASPPQAGTQARDASALTVTPDLAGALPRTFAARAADAANVRDVGARGDVVSVPLATDAAAGSRVLDFTASPPVHPGEAVAGPNVPAGAVVASSLGSRVTLSSPLAGADGSGTLIDFTTHDDAPAFIAAEAALPHGGTINVPSGRYHLGGTIRERAGITYRLDDASTSFGSAGVPNFTDQSQVQALSAIAISRQFASTMQENDEYLSAYAVPTGSRVSYQKNVESIRLTNSDPSVSWTDAAGVGHTAHHDLVGQFIIAEMPSANRYGSLWNTNWVLALDAGSKGGAILQEAQIINRRTAPVTELDDLDPVSGYDWIFDGSSRDTYGLLLQGTVTGGGPGLENGILFRRGAIRAALIANRTAAYAGGDGHVGRHLDNFHVMSDGSLFAQALHVGGGESSGSLAGEVLPTAGLSVDRDGMLTAPGIAATGILSAVGFSVTGNVNGAVALGSRTRTLTPLIDFDSGTTSSCRIFGNTGSNLDFSCLDPATGALLNDLILYPAGAAFQVPASFPAISVGGVRGAAGGARIAGGLVADTVVTTGPVRAGAGIVTAQTGSRTIRAGDCGTTIRDTGGIRHAYMVPAGLPIGCRVDVLQEGAGQVTFTAGAGETIEAFGTAATTAGLHAHTQLLIDTGTTFNVHP